MLGSYLDSLIAPCSGCLVGDVKGRERFVRLVKNVLLSGMATMGSGDS